MLSERAFKVGMGRLVACLKDRDLPEEILAVRADVYREKAAHLTDASWSWAVEQAIEYEEWFPPVAKLLDYAGNMPRSMEPANMFPGLSAPAPVTRSERDRVNAEGLALCKAELLKHGIDVGCVGRAMPEKATA